MTKTAAADDERHRLTAVQGLAALSLDALSSVAYGPEAILVVLVAAGAAGLHYSLPVTGAIIVLLTALVVSYRQVIAAFPNGGGAYAVSKAHLGTQASLVAAASLIVDYVLNAAVGVSAGIEALTSAFPSLYGASVWLCLAALVIITGLNLWGVSESAKVFTVPTVAFIAAMVAVIVGGLFRAHPAVVLDTHLGASTEAVGILLVLKAFASGCSALTGVEAIANAVPEFRTPRAHRAQHTEVWLGILLGGMLIGLGILIKKFHVVPHSTITVLAQLTEASLGHNFFYYAIQLITMVLLALAANTSFGGLPVLAALLARDNFLPHMFGLRADRQVHRYGVVVLAILAAALLVASNGNTQALIPLFAVGVFIATWRFRPADGRRRRDLLWLAGNRRLHRCGYSVSVIVDVLNLLRRLRRGGLCFGLIDRFLLVGFTSRCECERGEECYRRKLNPESLVHRCCSFRTSFVSEVRQ